MLSAVPVLVVRWLVPVTLTVPPPVATKAFEAPVSSVMPPVKLMVPPVLLVSEMPPPASLLSVMAPEKATVPPVWLATEADRPVPLPIAPP